MPSARAQSSPPLTGDLTAHPRTPFTLFTLWEYIRLMCSVGLFFLIAVCFSVPSAILGLMSYLHVAPTLWQRIISSLFRFWLRCSHWMGVLDISVPEAEKLAALNGTLVAPNHPSLLDAVIILSHMPRATCIMRANLMKSPAFGGAARLAGYVTNDSGAALVRQGVEKIHRGDNLLIFPEGTRTGNQAVRPFKKGFALVATRTRAPIQTVLIEREGIYLSKQSSLFARCPLPIRIRVHLGELIHPGEKESPQELARRLEQYFRGQLVNNGRDIRLKTPYTA